ncbi:TPA: insulinase family protein, partial [bacterium]|nr:insulinase family protein [bacterium]
MNNIGRNIIMILIGCFAFMIAGTTSGSEAIKKVLDNGMIIIVKENHSAPVVSLHAYAKAGSIYEAEFMGRGISHNLEHLMSNGTQKRTKQEINRIIEEIGNGSNAYTTKDHASYFITTASAYFDIALDVLSDYMQNAELIQEEVDSERGVILNEINMRDDDPDSELYEIFSDIMFPNHPIGVPVIGYRELFEKTTRDDLIKYYKRMYVPNNMIFVAVGDFDAQEALGKIESAFKDAKRGPLPNFSLPSLPNQVSKRYTEKEMDVQIAYMMMGFPTISISHKDLYPLDVLAFIMGEGRSSRLYKKIKDEKQLVYAISVGSYTPSYDGGYFGIQAVLDPDNIVGAEKAILEELYKIKTELITDEELEKAKQLKESEYIFSQQTMESQAETLGIDQLSTGDMNFSKRYLEGIKSVKKEDLMRVANEYFHDDKLNVAIIKPKLETEETSAKMEKEASDSSVKKILINKNPDPASSQIEGITLLVKENHSIPIVSMHALFLGGVRFEDESNNGVCKFMTDMLTKGTKTRTSQQIAEEIESIGGAIGTISGNNSFSVSVSVLKRDIDKGLDILSDVIMNPSFDTVEIEKKRKELLAGIKRQEDDPFSLAGKLCRTTLFKTHPYRFQTIGSEETINKMTQNDLKSFYDKYMLPNNMVLAVFGDINADEITAKIEKAFEKFEYKKFETPKAPIEQPLTSVREAEAQKDIAQAVVYIGFPGMTVYSEDRYPMQVLDAILSGINYPGGRLHERLRSNQLVYVVHAINQEGLDPGMFIIYAGTTPDKLDTVMGIIKEEIVSLQKDLISDEELER